MAATKASNAVLFPSTSSSAAAADAAVAARRVFSTFMGSLLMPSTINGIGTTYYGKGNLDTRSGLEVLSIFQELNREGKTVVLITHDREVAAMAGRILELVDGRIVSDTLAESPKDARRELEVTP